MARVVVWSSLKAHTGGETHLDVPAENVKDLLARLGDAYPGLQSQLKRGVSVSVDGIIFRDGWLTPLKPDSEVVLLPRMQGG